MQNFWIVFKSHLSAGVPAIKCLCLPVHVNVCLGGCVCSHPGVHIFACGCEGFHPIWDCEGTVPLIKIKHSSSEMSAVEETSGLGRGWGGRVSLSLLDTLAGILADTLPLPAHGEQEEASEYI